MDHTAAGSLIGIGMILGSVVTVAAGLFLRPSVDTPQQKSVDILVDEDGRRWDLNSPTEMLWLRQLRPELFAEVE